MVEIITAKQETWLQSQGQKEPLEKGIRAWRILWIEEPGRQFMGSKRVGHD